MKFANPNVLYFLVLLIIPIIIHLFNFRRYKKFYFSSLSFIKKVEKETNSKRNLRHLILLFTRLIAFSALILAFAQPYFPKSGEINSLNSVVPIYLDNSFSMSAKGENGDLLNHAKMAVEEIIRSYPKEQSYILTTNALSGAELQIITRSELLDKLEEVSFSPLSRKVATPLASIHEFLVNNNHNAATHYYALSDFQRSFLDNNVSNLDTTAHYSFLQVTPQNNNNIYIDSVWFDQPFQRANVNSTLNISIHNTADSELTNVEINVTIDGKKRQTLADLSANNNTVVTLNFTDKTTGIKSGLVEVIDEQLYFDNKFYFTYEIKEAIQALVIHDKNSTNFPQLVYQTDEYYQVEQVAVDQLKLEQLNTADILVLNELQRISSGLITQIKQIVENGVHLLIIPAPNFEKNSYNELLAGFQLPLYGEALQKEIRIGKIMAELDFFKGMFDDKIDQLRIPPLKAYISSSTYSNANYNPLILYENGMPLLVEQAKNRNVYALYSPISPNFNDFGKSALFAASLLRMSEISQGKKPLWLTIGSAEESTIRHSTNKDQVFVLQQKDLAFIPEVTTRNAFSNISVRHALNHLMIQDGQYDVLQNNEAIDQLSLNYNRLESDMNYASPVEISNAFKTMGIKQINAEGIVSLTDIHKLSIKKPNEFWRILLILALVFFLIEMGLIIIWKV